MRTRFLCIWVCGIAGGAAVLLSTARPGLADAPQVMAAMPVPEAVVSGAYRLSLEEARERALANNKALGLARLNAEEKQHATAAASKDYFPKVLGNITYFRFDKDLGSVLTIQRGQHGILPPATQTFNTAVLNQNTSLGTIMLAQPITKLIAVNALVQIAKADENIAQAKLDQGSKEVVWGVSQAYYGLLGALRIQSALELQAGLLKQISGEKPTPELRVGLLEVRQGIVDVRGQVDQISGQLRDLIDFPPEMSIELVDPVPPTAPVSSADEAAAMALATCNADLIEAEQNIHKARAAMKLAKMDYLPDVNVIGGYANQTGTDAIQENIGYFGATATYTFWAWGKRNNVMSQRQTQVALAHGNLNATRDKVCLAARKAYGVYALALEAHQLADEMVDARLDGEKAASDPVAVISAKSATAKAQLEAMKAEIAYRVAYAQLMQAIGQ